MLRRVVGLGCDFTHSLLTIGVVWCLPWWGSPETEGLLLSTSMVCSVVIVAQRESIQSLPQMTREGWKCANTLSSFLWQKYLIETTYAGKDWCVCLVTSESVLHSYVAHGGRNVASPCSGQVNRGDYSSQGDSSDPSKGSITCENSAIGWGHMWSYWDISHSVHDSEQQENSC